MISRLQTKWPTAGCWIGSQILHLEPVSYFLSSQKTKHLFLSLFTIGADNTIIQSNMPAQLGTSLSHFFLSRFTFKPSVSCWPCSLRICPKSSHSSPVPVPSLWELRNRLLVFVIPFLTSLIGPLPSCQWSFKNLHQISSHPGSKFSNGSNHTSAKSKDPQATRCYMVWHLVMSLVSSSTRLSAAATRTSWLFLHVRPALTGGSLPATLAGALCLASLSSGLWLNLT